MTTTGKRFKIGTRWVGDGEPCYVIAEAGSNHNGNLAQALALVDVASEAGATAVKFQGFRARTLYPENAGKSAYLRDARPIFEIIESMEMPVEWLPMLADHCRSRGVDFLCTPFDEEWVDLLRPYVPAFKIASYELSHLPLVEKVLACEKPTFISTGASALGEVTRVVDLARTLGNEWVILFQCTAAYPAPLADVNARAMVTMREATGCLVGLSDHSRDPVIAPVLAVALGAVAIEKHFTLSNRLPGPDQRFAVEPEELRHMIRAIRDAEAALGTGAKEVLAVERELHAFARRSVFAIRAIKAGETFSTENVRVLRNGENHPGLPPSEYPNLLGRRAATDVPAGHAIGPSMVRDAAELS